MMNCWTFLTCFYRNRDMTICNFFDVYVFILWRTAHRCQYLIHSVFLCFSRGRQSPALIAIHKISAGSISFLIIGYDATASSNELLVLAGGAMGGALDLRSAGRGFKSYSGKSCVTALCKLFTPMCFCYQGV